MEQGGADGEAGKRWPVSMGPAGSTEGRYAGDACPVPGTAHMHMLTHVCPLRHLHMLLQGDHSPHPHFGHRTKGQRLLREQPAQAAAVRGPQDWVLSRSVHSA